MRVRLEIILLLLVFYFSFKVSEAQQNFKFYDSLSFNLYQKAKWDSLVLIGKNAISDGNDYFYLRMRLGAARMEQGKFLFAIKHFNKAFKFNEADSNLLKYLSYAHILANQRTESQYFFNKMSGSVKKNYKMPKHSIFTSVDASVSTSFSNNNKLIETTDINGIENILGFYDSYDKAQHYKLGLEHRIGKQFYLQYEINQQYFNNFVFSKFNDIVVVDSILKPKPFGYGYGIFYEKIYKLKEVEYKNNYTINQKQIYLKAQYKFHKKIALMGSVNFVGGSFTKEIPYLSEVYYQRQSIDTYLVKKLQVNFKAENSTFKNSIIALGVQKNWNVFSSRFEFITSDLNDNKQKQMSVEINSFPLGNFDFYTKTNLSVLQQKQVGPKVILSQLLGLKLDKNVYLDAYYKFGDMLNYTEQMGQYVYNSTDIMKSMYGFELNILVTKNLSLSLLFNQSKFHSIFNSYSNFILVNEYPIFYKQTTIKGGFTWKF